MTAHPPQIVVAEPYSAEALKRLAEIGRVVELPFSDPDSLLRSSGDCDALLIRTASVVDARLLDAAPRLRVIGRAGVGLDNVDLEAAAARGIVVVYTPTAGTDAVADLTIGLLISLARNLPGMDTAIRSGRFRQARSAATGPELHDLTVGVVGMGRIGRAVARRCRNGFGMRILFNDILSPGWLDFVAEPRSKEDLYAESDVVTLHVPLTPDTRGLVDDNALARFRPGALLINTARGAIVDAAAIARALSTGRLAGFATDVFDVEPPPADHPLLAAPHTVFTPHIGAKTPQAQERMNDVVDDVIRVLRGEPPLFPA